MKKLVPLLITFMLLTACQQVSASNTPAAPTPTPTPTPKPTEKPSLTPTEQHAEVNPATSVTLWPADVQARFKDVLTDPWTATAAEKTAYDTFLTTQWQLTLKDAGVANAETLQGYDLLNAIIEHQPPVVLTGTETPEQLASYVVELPFSLHKLLRTDQNNLVGYHHEDGRYIEGKIPSRPNGLPPAEFRGPLQKTPYDLGYLASFYGFGATETPRPDHAELLKDMGYLSSTTYPDNYGFDFYGEKIPAIGVWDAPEGDLMFLFRIPGTDPNTAVGAMLRMYDGFQIRYTEAFIPFSNNTTTQTDTCLLPGGGIITTDSCPVGYSVPPAVMIDSISGTRGNGTLYFLLKLMSFYKNPHVSLQGDGTIQVEWIWKDGISVMGGVLTPNLPDGFFNKP